MRIPVTPALRRLDCSSGLILWIHQAFYKKHQSILIEIDLRANRTTTFPRARRAALRHKYIARALVTSEETRDSESSTRIGHCFRR